MAHTDHSEDLLLQPHPKIACNGALLVGGTPFCGKSTLKEVLEAASKYVLGHEFFDSSTVMDWHIDVANNSPFYAEFTGQVTRDRAAGDLADDLLVCRGISYRLQACLKEREKTMNKHESSIRRVNLFGAPRTGQQYKILSKMFPGATMIGIRQTEDRANSMRLKKARGNDRHDDAEGPFRNRWVKYRAKTEPFMKEGEEAGFILMMDFADTLQSKSIRAVNAMSGLTEVERSSLHRQMLSDKCEAFWLIQKIDHPKDYKAFIEEIKQNPTRDWHHTWLNKMKLGKQMPFMAPHAVEAAV
jgi:adenylate kinase family enzyme